MKKKRNLKKILIIPLIIIAMISLLCNCIFWGNQPYDAEYLANAETKMWKAYYSKDKATLGWLLVQTLRRQFQISIIEATSSGKTFADSAMAFKSGDYDKALDELVVAYSKIKEYSSMSFDPKEVAKAELKWWVDRRTPGQDDPKNIGAGIGALYEKIYCYKHPGFTRAGLLRAEAAHIRDEGGVNCDWKLVNAKLLLSYQALQDGIEKKNGEK